MSLLYVTADKIGAQSGGGRVTQEEMTAVFDLSVELGKEFLSWDRSFLCGSMPQGEPWTWDIDASKRLLLDRGGLDTFQLAHFYAGTFSDTVANVKRAGAKVTYTAAAHDIEKSRTEHHKLGMTFDYLHLDKPDLWQRYVAGYLAADVVICPSQHSAECMRSYGCKQVEVIPHGVDIPEKLPDELPARTHKFVVGYLGAIGPDKGLVYLIQAWEKLAWQDATLIFGGRDSDSPFMRQLLDRFGHRGNYQLLGWVEDIAYFYNSLDLYVQPSITEGFGIEVLEAMAHGCGVLCSDGAGAADVVPEPWRFPAGDVTALAECIRKIRQIGTKWIGLVGRELVKQYEWSIIRKHYQEVWRRLLDE